MKEEVSINKPYNGNPDWNVGGLFGYDSFWIPLFFGIKEMGVKIPIQYIYGTPKNLKAGGGRRLAFLNQNDEQYSDREKVAIYNGLGIGCRLALSNHLLQPSDYEEEELNNYLSLVNFNNNNGVIITDDKFNEYIQENYPNLQRICSIIRPAIDTGWGNETPEYYNELCEKYDIVVVSCGFAKDLNKMNQLKYKDKIEILVNTRCTLNCKLAKTHYTIVANNYLINNNATEEQQKKLDEQEQALWAECLSIKRQDVFNGANFFWEEIQQLLDNGFHHFKLEGRNWPIEVLCKDMCSYVCDDVLFTRLCTNGLGIMV